MIDTLMRLLDMLAQLVVLEAKRADSRHHRNQVQDTRSDPQGAFADRFNTGVYGNLDPIAVPGDPAESAHGDLRAGPDHHP